MKRIVRLTESDLTRIVRRVIMEQATTTQPVKVMGVKLGTAKINDIPFDVMGERATVETTSDNQKLPTLIGSGKWGKQQATYRVHYFCGKDKHVIKQVDSSGVESKRMEISQAAINFPNAEELCNQHRNYLSKQKNVKY